MLRVLMGPLAGLSLAFVACSPQATKAPVKEPPTASAKEKVEGPDSQADQGPIFQPFVGEQKLIDAGSVSAAYEFVGEHQGKLVVALSLQEGWRVQAYRSLTRESAGAPILPDAQVFLHSKAAALEFVVSNDEDTNQGGPLGELKDRLWLLVEPAALDALDLTLYANFSEGDPKGSAAKLQVKTVGTLPSRTTGAEATWGRALSRYLDTLGAASLTNSFRNRLDALYAGAPAQTASGERASPRESDWGELMSLVSGHESVERALAYRDGLTLKERRFEPSVPLSSLEMPVARSHDWARMLKGLSAQHEVPELSQSVPAEFYFVHAKSGESLFLLLDELSRFLTPAAHLLERRGAGYRLSERYQTQLGVVRGPLSRALGPKVIQEVAVVGSDPFLRRGSDLTIIFEASKRAMLQAGLADALHRAASGRGEIIEARSELRGRELVHSRTADGAVSRFLVVEGARIYVSNSRNALERVLEARDGRRERLSEEPDFRYMMSRDDNAKHDVLAFAGDRFVSEIISPRARILDARRLLALGELKRVGRAALLSGLMGAEVKADPPFLVKSGMLAKEHARHFDGATIEAGPSSAWGTPASSIPLIDLPNPEKVTAAEKEAYDDFVRGYNADWGEVIDPVALRMNLDDEGKGFEAHLRVLPLINDRQYREIQEFVGGQRLRFRGSALGAQAVLGIAEDSSLRRELTGSSHGLLGQDLKLDWLGEYAFLGVEDRNELTQIFSAFAPSEQRLGQREQLDKLAELPAYVGVKLRSRAGAEVTMALLRAAVPSSAGIKWEKPVDYKGVPIHTAKIAEMGFSLRLHYAIGKETLFFALQEGTIRRLIDSEQASELPLAHPQGRAQFALESRQRPGGGLSTVLAWMFEDEILDEGDPGLQRAQLLSMALSANGRAAKELEFPRLLALLGEVPVSPDGFYYEGYEYGVIDPQRGNWIVERAPKLPIAGSYVDLVLGKLKLARFEMSFDPEAPEKGGERGRSLSVHMTLERD